jgi:hypothetical protein
MTGPTRYGVHATEQRRVRQRSQFLWVLRGVIGTATLSAGIDLASIWQARSRL